MYFVFSKLLIFLLYPINWIIILLLITAFTKKRRLRNYTALASVILLLIFSSPYLLDVFAWRWNINFKPLPASAQYSCVVVLGGFSGSDGNGSGRFNEAADRFIQGMKLKVTGKASHILISSGNGNLMAGSFFEADWVKMQLKEFNFADSTILIENKSRNTIENAKFSKALLLQNSLKPPYLLVTSAFHMRRALMIFKKEGMDVIPYPCNYIAGKKIHSIVDLIPDTTILINWNVYMKEMIGYVVNYFMK